jgi:NADH-quinone oxidoreductase subunit E
MVDRNLGQRGGLISTLEGIQAKYGYLPEGALRAVAERTGRPLIDIYGVATFYRAFSLEPRGRHLCSVCVGTACHVRGALQVRDEFVQQLEAEAGRTTADGEFTLDTVNCLGACALGPIVVVDGTAHQRRPAAGRQHPRHGERGPRLQPHRRPAGVPVEVCCARCNHSLMDPENPIEDQPSVRVTISFGRRHGWLLLSSLYGSYTIESEHEIPPDTVANFFCPHCHAELAGAANCPLCAAPMVPLIVRGGGMVQICSRRGCRSHMLDVNGVNL